MPIPGFSKSKLFHDYATAQCFKTQRNNIVLMSQNKHSKHRFSESFQRYNANTLIKFLSYFVMAEAS